MVRTLAWPSGPGLNPNREHCVVFLGKTLQSHSTSPHSGVKMDTGWGCGLRKITRSPKSPNHEILSVQHLKVLGHVILGLPI